MPGALLTEARPVRRAPAAGHPTAATAEVRGLCAQLGIEVVPADAGPDAADRALLSAALQLHAAGVSSWYVASHDPLFSALPGTVTVPSTGHGKPGRTLTQRAVEVRRIAGHRQGDQR